MQEDINILQYCAQGKYAGRYKRLQYCAQGKLNIQECINLYSTVPRVESTEWRYAGR